ncbi:transcription factor Gibbin [Aplochiton taeniatus]
MSRLSGRLRSAVVGPGAFGGALAEDEEECGGELKALESPGGWPREVLGPQQGALPSMEGAPVTYDLFPRAAPSPGLANGLHLHRRLGLSTRRRRQLDGPSHSSPHALARADGDMQAHVDADVSAQAQAASQTHTEALAAHVHGAVRASPAETEQVSTVSPETHTASPQPLPLSLVNHPPASNRSSIPPVVTAVTDMPPTLCPVPTELNSTSGLSPPQIEGERKYALRSSGRPRFPCHLRKSSRLRRSPDDGERRGARERGGEEDEMEEFEEKIWRVKEETEKEEVRVQEKERPLVEALLPTPLFPVDIPAPLPLSVPKSVPKAGPKAMSRAAPKSVSRAAPKAGPRATHSAPPRPASNSLPRPAVKKTEPLEGEISPPTKRKRGRFVGVRKIVVMVARIPVNLSRRQKSYKISNMETEKGALGTEGGLEGAEAVREPTALLRMKNNGKSVMVMFPPGELPVILKRRRGRPPKQAVPGIPCDSRSFGTAAGNGDQPKKPRRQRRTKLPSPQPSYVNDTNDVKAEYGDVLSKLAFLNRQPPTTGRCSPPRCWTPSEPESFHVPSENPGISTLLHRLTGFRRRGGRGGGLGSRGGGAAGGAAGTEGFKSSFSDFFETIGKKRKMGGPSEPGLPKKRGKGAGGRGGGIVGGVGGEKGVRKRRPRKNGMLKGGEVGPAGEDWANGGGVWGEEGCSEKGVGRYQACSSPRGSFPSCDGGRRGAYSSPGGGRGAGGAGEDSQGLFAGYFRSLLDSDDSSDLLDISSSRPDPRKAPSTPGYESPSPAPGPNWSPAFPKRNPKTPGGRLEGPAQSQSSSSRLPYNYSSLAQTSPTTPNYPKSNPPSLSLSRSPSSPHPSSYGHYPSGYSSSHSGGGAASQRHPDCSFSYGGGHCSGKTIPISQGHMGYSMYQAAAKRGYSGYPGAVHSSMGRGETAGPSSPSGGHMGMAKNSPFSSLSPEGYRQYPGNQWNYRHGFSGWAADGFGSQYYGYSEYGSISGEPKDILDISNYTPQKAKRQPFLESLSESSSDSSHLGSGAAGGGAGSGGGTYKPKEPPPIDGEGGQSSLSSLEKLMMDWHESAAGPSYNWSQNVLFQGGGSSKQGRGRRKRAEPQSEKEGGSAATSGAPPDSPSSPPQVQASGPKRGTVGGRQTRGARGARGGLSPCHQERGPGAKAKAKAASASTGAGGSGAGSGLFQEGLDYYSGDSSSLSPLATPNPAPPVSYPPDTCEYPSPYSAHPSTPSSEERYPSHYPGESSSSLSPSVSSSPYPPKPTPPPPQTYHPVPNRNFSPSCSPSSRLTPHCSTALSPPHRTAQKDPQYSQYDSPSYCGSPYWYGQASHSGSPSPHGSITHLNTHTHASAHTNPHTNTHMSPHGNTHANPLASPHPHNAHAHPNLNSHAHNTQSHANAQHLSPHPNPNSHPHQNTHLHSAHHPHPNNPAQPHPNTHANPHLHSHPNPSPHSHSTSSLVYEERSPPSALAPHKRDLSLHMSSGHRQAPLPHSPYHKLPLDSSSHPEEMGYPLPPHSYQGMPQRYPPQPARGGGVLCQLLDPPSEDSFSVTSL